MQKEEVARRKGKCKGRVVKGQIESEGRMQRNEKVEREKLVLDA